MTTVHRALVRTGCRVSVCERPTPVPGRHELLVAPLVAGLCGTDIQMLRGLREDSTPIIGHEGVARIVAVGGDIPGNLVPGTLVCVNPTHRDDPNFLLGHNVAGLLQERVLIPASAVMGGLVLPLPEASNSELAALLEPLAVTRYALDLLAVHEPHTFVVFGDGTIGHIAIRAAAETSRLVRIILVHHTEQGVEWSRNHNPLSVHEILHDEAGAEQLSQLSQRERVAVLLATPRDATLRCLDTALCSLPGELQIDLLGGLPSNAKSSLLPHVDLNQIRAANCAVAPRNALRVAAQTTTGRPICLLGHRGVPHSYLRAAAAELLEAPLRYSDLITHRVNLDDAAPILEQLAVYRTRIIGDHRLVKLAVQVAPPDTEFGEAR